MDHELYGSCWDASIFSIGSRDWFLIYWCTLWHDGPLSGCWFGYTITLWDIATMESNFCWSLAGLLDSLHRGISILQRVIRFIHYIGASDEWYGDYWIVSSCPHCILGHNHIRGHHFMLGHNHLDGCLALRYGHLIEDFDGSWSWWHFGFNLLSILD